MSSILRIVGKIIFKGLFRSWTKGSIGRKRWFGKGDTPLLKYTWMTRNRRRMIGVNLLLFCQVYTNGESLRWSRSFWNLMKLRMRWKSPRSRNKDLACQKRLTQDLNKMTVSYNRSKQKRERPTPRSQIRDRRLIRLSRMLTQNTHFNR